MTEEDPIRRAARWKAFYEEPGGIRDMLATIRASYFMKLDEIEPWQSAQLANMAIAAKIVKELDKAVIAVTTKGKMAEAAKAHAEATAAIPDFKRRHL